MNQLTGAGYFILVKLAENPTFIYLWKITGGLYHKTFYDRNIFYSGKLEYLALSTVKHSTLF